MYYYERYNDIYGINKAKVVEDPIFEKYGVKIKWVTKKSESGTVYVNELACYAWARHYAELYPEADPVFVMAIIKAESDFRANAVSKSNACGLMQMLEPTYDDIREIMPTDRPFARIISDPQYAVKCGMCYLQWLHTPSIGLGNSDINIAAAYNGGPGNARIWLADGGMSSGGVLIADKIPRDETRNYVKKVMANYEYYREYLGLIYSKEN
jgi:soluble lytic murein transglycosylase